MELGRYMIARRFVLFGYLQCHLLLVGLRTGELVTQVLSLGGLFCVR